MSRKILSELPDISSPQLFLLIRAKYLQHKALKAMGILSSEQMRGPRKM